jgi:hypothetical protein
MFIKKSRFFFYFCQNKFQIVLVDQLKFNQTFIFKNEVQSGQNQIINEKNVLCIC